MIGNRSLRAGLGAVVLAAAIATGCSNEDAGTPSNPGGGPELPTTSTAQPVDAKAPNESLTPDSAPGVTEPADAMPPPLPDQPVSGGVEDAKLLTHVYNHLGVETLEEYAWSVSAMTSEIAIGECMSAAGFQYTPMQASPSPERTMPPEEYAARYGLGMVAFGLGLLGGTMDPNFEQRAAMSEGERAAFDQARYNCMENAPPENPDARLGPGGGVALTVALEQFRAIVDNDERVVAALGEWQTCMAAAGFAYENQWAMRDAFANRLTDAGDMSQAEMEAFLAEEIVAATANVRCIAPYTDTYRQVIADRFAEFKTMYDTALATGAQPGGASG